MKEGDLVIVMNSGGQIAILLRPWPARKKYEIGNNQFEHLTDDGWEIWWPEHHRQYVIMESWNLELYENV